MQNAIEDEDISEDERDEEEEERKEEEEGIEEEEEREIDLDEYYAQESSELVSLGLKEEVNDPSYESLFDNDDSEYKLSQALKRSFIE